MNPTAMLLPVLTEPSHLRVEQRDHQSRAVEPGVLRVPLEIAGHVNAEVIRVDSGHAVVAQPVDVPTQHQAAMLEVARVPGARRSSPAAMSNQAR
ncbi:hypothetical protein [Isoptericola sp. NPDC056134]|uniref:hypothetical protein n=1 Tax=Isoptericola sp. NPDC056134 TaxID=3345723 RepID=UPI0035E6E819